MDIEQLLKNRQLDLCLEQTCGQLQREPGNIRQRVFLFQLLCVLNEFERANEQLDILADLSDSNLALKNTYQALIAAEKFRNQVIAGTRAPTIFGQPPLWVSYYVQALASYNLGNLPRAKKEIEAGADQAPAIAGTINGESFLWLADADVRFGPLLEIIINGRYYWLPFSRIRQLLIEDFEDLRDLVWCPCHLTLENQAEMIAFIPTRYPALPTGESLENTGDHHALCLASTTLWQTPQENFYIGQGLRSFITDKSEYPLSDINTVTLDLESPR